MLPPILLSLHQPSSIPNTRAKTDTTQLNTPFILAPPLAVQTFYASISGALTLPPPYHAFHIFPCLNPPVLAFEFDGWQFPAMQGGKGARWMGMPGGRFSLGRYREGSGYCVGAVVETSVGTGRGEHGVGNVGRKGEVAGNGMRDVWVLGEGFFRGVGGVFDVSCPFCASCFFSKKLVSKEGG